MACAPSKDSDQLGHLPTECTTKTLIRLGRCPGWSESLLGAQSFYLFCHEVAQLFCYKREEILWFLCLLPVLYLVCLYSSHLRARTWQKLQNVRLATRVNKFRDSMTCNVTIESVFNAINNTCQENRKEKLILHHMGKIFISKLP